MKLNLNILSEEEKRRIHVDSLKILGEVGVKFMSDKALDILDRNGAVVDRDSRVARMPEEMVQQALSTLPLVLSGVDVVNGTGELDTSQLLVLEQIVVDHEIALMCQRYKQGIDVSDAKDLYTDVKSAQAGGHFLMQPGTLKYCRSNEFFQPALSDRNTYEHWEELGKPDLYSNARNKVEQILAGPLKNPLPDDVLGKLEKIGRKADEALKEK